MGQGAARALRREQRAAKFCAISAQTLKPAIVNGHLAVARAVGSGEYLIALTNYVNLTLNVKLAGAPTDYWAIDPVGVFYMQMSASAQAPHPNAARLGANFILSQEGQSLLAVRGRIPSRPDVETNPPGVLKALLAKKVMPIVLDPRAGEEGGRLIQGIDRRAAVKRESAMDHVNAPIWTLASMPHSAPSRHVARIRLRGVLVHSGLVRRPPPGSIRSSSKPPRKKDRWSSIRRSTRKRRCRSGRRFEHETGTQSRIRARLRRSAGRADPIEARAGKQAWDLMQTPSVHKLPQQLLALIDLPEARHALPEARDPNHRWQGVTAIYQTPAYNTKLVAEAELPQSHEDFAKLSKCAGRVAINDNDSEWLMSLLSFYGEDKGRALIQSMVTTLKPVMVSGHLALARAVAAGEYALALSNYAHLTHERQAKRRRDRFLRARSGRCVLQRSRRRRPGARIRMPRGLPPITCSASRRSSN